MENACRSSAFWKIRDHRLSFHKLLSTKMAEFSKFEIFIGISMSDLTRHQNFILKNFFKIRKFWKVYKSKKQTNFILFRWSRRRNSFHKLKKNFLDFDSESVIFHFDNHTRVSWDGSKRHQRMSCHMMAYACDFEMAQNSNHSVSL